MKTTACLLMMVCILAACGDDSGGGNTRFVDQQKVPCNPIVPIRHADDAVHTEAMVAMRTIYGQVKLKGATSSNKAAFYQSLNGEVDGATLKALGLTAAHLKGSYYVASDYTISISGSTLTISAADKGTRGRVDPQTFKLP